MGLGQWPRPEPPVHACSARSLPGRALRRPQVISIVRSRLQLRDENAAGKRSLCGRTWTASSMSLRGRAHGDDVGEWRPRSHCAFLTESPTEHPAFSVKGTGDGNEPGNEHRRGVCVSSETR